MTPGLCQQTFVITSPLPEVVVIEKPQRTLFLTRGRAIGMDCLSPPGGIGLSWQCVTGIKCFVLHLEETAVKLFFS